MSDRKFVGGARVRLNHGLYGGLPRGSIGSIEFCGMRRAGKWSYHVKFDDQADVLEVAEDELVAWVATSQFPNGSRVQINHDNYAGTLPRGTTGEVDSCYTSPSGERFYVVKFRPGGDCEVLTEWELTAAPTHLDIIRKAYDECGITYRVFPHDEDPRYQYLIYTGGDDPDYKNLTCKQALRECRKFMEFYNGGIASY